MTYWLAILFLVLGLPLMLALSLIVARRESLAEIELIFDRRILSRTFRTARRFGIGKILWFTTLVATVCALARLVGNVPCALVLFGIIGLTILLIRAFLVSLTERGVRRKHPDRLDVEADLPSRPPEELKQISELDL